MNTEPCGPSGPAPPALGPRSLLWQSVHSVRLEVVHGAMRLGTL